MAAKKRSTAKRSAKVKLRSEVKAIIWFALSLFLMALVFIKGENFWTDMHKFIFGVFGVTAFVVPFFMCAIACFYALNKLTSTAKIKFIEGGAFLVILNATIDVFMKCNREVDYLHHLSDAYKLGKSISGGGFLGALIGDPLYRAFGKTGAAVTFILILFVLLMLLTGTTLIALFKAISSPAKAVAREAQNAAEERAERENTGAKTPKLVKGFNVDIPLDTPAQTKRHNIKDTLNDKKKKLVESYTGEEYTPEEDATSVDEALDTAQSDAAPEKITVDMKAETEKVTKEIAEGEDMGIGYVKPPITLLKEVSSADAKAKEAELKVTSERLVETLRSFGVETRVVDVSRGPTVTRYELQPRAGVKISKITSLADDIALNLAASGVRIEAPIPNKAAVGIEVPNKASAVVGIREIIESPTFTSSRSKLTVAMGRDIGGNVVVADISKMPHGLIAGATGSGKSVCINSIIMSILYKATPEEVKLLMIDPKVVELGVYNGIPHLMVPVVTEPRKAAGALGWAVEEMEKRYRMFADRNVRDIEGYNRFVDTLKDEPDIKPIPHIVIIIDELADLMMTSPHEVEDSINRIAAKARAAGMHLLIATQRPSVDVVTGVIKANIPTRIAFAVSSQIDSRTILDTAGAEKLLGRGDMLFSPMGANKPKRVQGCFVSDEEVERVVEYVKKSAKAEYDESVMEEIERNATAEKQKKGVSDGEEGDELDALFDEAVRIVVESGMASTSYLQRKLKLGYARASRIVDQMEEKGVVGPFEGSKPRKVLITKEQLMEREAGEE